MKRTRTARWGVMTACLALLTLGCAFGDIRLDDPMGRQYALEEQQASYTEYVRWGAFDYASRFVDPTVRAEYMASAPRFEEIRFSDYESQAVEVDAEKATATVIVTYTAYDLRSSLIVPVTETQEWTRVSGNNWLVKPTFDGLDRLRTN